MQYKEVELNKKERRKLFQNYNYDLILKTLWIYTCKNCHPSR